MGDYKTRKKWRWDGRERYECLWVKLRWRSTRKSEKKRLRCPRESMEGGEVMKTLYEGVVIPTRGTGKSTNWKFLTAKIDRKISDLT